MPRMPGMKYFGAANHAALWKFWGEDGGVADDQRGYFKELFAAPGKKRSKRDDTESLTLRFDAKKIIVVVTMNKGKKAEFRCSQFNRRESAAAAVEFMTIMDGNRNRAGKLAELFQQVGTEGEVIITRDEIKLGAGGGTDETDAPTAKEPEERRR